MPHLVIIAIKFGKRENGNGRQCHGKLHLDATNDGRGFGMKPHACYPPSGSDKDVFKIVAGKPCCYV